MGEVFYNQIGTDGCEEKFYDWKIYCCKFSLILSPSAANKKFNIIGSRCAALKFSSARAARLFFVFQPITFLICSVVVAVAIRNMIAWLNGEKLSCWTCSTHFSIIPWRSLSKDNVKFSNTTRARRSIKSFISWLFMKIIRPNQMKGHFADFEQHDKHEIIAERPTYRKWSEVFFAAAVVALTLGSLSKHDVDGSENVIWKWNF